MLLLPQRYVFSSKSQPWRGYNTWSSSCYCYHKGTYFQANHNSKRIKKTILKVVIATTKVRIFKQITTAGYKTLRSSRLLLLPQRYVFSSKSQLACFNSAIFLGCYCYHKGTYFQANHNHSMSIRLLQAVVIATTKVRIFKQITTLY